MLLAIDIGNTDTVTGVFDNDNLIDHFRVGSKHSLTVDECGFFITGLLKRMDIKTTGLKQVVIGSVVPRLTPIYEKMSEKYFKLGSLIVSSAIKLPVKIAYDDPSAVGADRIANAVAGFDKFGGPLIIVDFGTTINFDVVTSDGQYLGGAIAPGPEMSAAQLAARAARLFEVRIEKPAHAIGRSTAESIKSGLFYGTVGQIDRIIDNICDEFGVKPKVIGTGGLAADFQENSKYIESVHPALTLEGLKLISDYQSA
ncbi:MAG: type III pantothenate kinase [Candidatus Zixiibacteriota bacterium]|nr:MAG: type III pantothenate kinase [candidate division Zixibacteria bacterium]